MPFESEGRVATLSGVVSVDEVETFVAWLRDTKAPEVDLRDCNHLHTGAVQAMMLFRPKVNAAPANGFLAAQVLPLLAESGGVPPRTESGPP